MKRSGQTLLELVIAAGVISISTLAAITLIIRTITVGTGSQMKTEASNYAREGVEVVRMIRDSNWLRADQNLPDGDDGLTKWDDERDTSFSNNNYYRPLFDPNNEGSTIAHYILNFTPTGGWTMTACAPTTSLCPVTARRIWLKQLTGQPVFARQGCGVAGCTIPTAYYRDIQITKVPETVAGVAGYYLDVLSSVTWSSRDGNHTVKAETRLYDWK
jgi:type II secretory pathway pseudopilin PulG